jgi:hypothetical protein
MVLIFIQCNQLAALARALMLARSRSRLVLAAVAVRDDRLPSSPSSVTPTQRVGCPQRFHLACHTGQQNICR